MRAVNQLKKVLRAIQSLWKLIYLHRNADIKWLAPRKAKIVVFDACGLETLVPLFDDEPYEVIHTRGERLYLTPAILWATFLNLTRVRHPFGAYILTLVQYSEPAIVVTFIDNNGLFGIVAQNYHEARFLAIQNGMRCIARDNPPGIRPIYLPEFACFGQYEIDMYTQTCAKVGKFYPIGSLKDSYYRESCAQEQRQAKFDLCLVSEADPELAQSYPEIEEAIKKLAIYVSKFCKKSKKTLCIAARNDPNENQQGFLYEFQYYRKHMGDGVNLIPNRQSEFATYHLIDASAVSISFFSTALVEALGRGRRSLFCNFTNYDWYDLPVKGLWFLKNPSYEEFEERLLGLLAIKEQEFQKISSSATSYMMNYDKSNSPHMFLRKLMAEAVSR